MTPLRRIWWHACLTPVVAACLSLAGCAFGPRQLERTHGQYNEAVRRVVEEQLLLNLVRMRYNEVPARLDVSSIAAQYELSSHAEARPFFSTEAVSGVFGQFSQILPFAAVSAASRPTISLTPDDDGGTVRRFLTPIPADTVVFLGRTSWPVSTVMRLWVERVNGVPNADSASGPPQPVVPDYERFRRITELCQLTQDRRLMVLHKEERDVPASGPLPREAVTVAGAVEAAKSDLECRLRADGATYELVRKQSVLVLEITAEGELSTEVAELLQLLHLQPGKKKYDLVTVGRAEPDPGKASLPLFDQIQLVSRSTSQVYFYLANGVEVPAEHVASGLAAVPVCDGKVFDLREVTRGLFEAKVCKGHKPPTNAYVAVCYRGYWYYVEDADQASKATFALMLQMSRLDLARQRPGSTPVLTLPVGR